MAINSPNKEHLMASISAFILKYIRAFEMTGVIMRIFSFSLVSWMGPDSPFMFVWIFNTADAIILSWCAIQKTFRSEYA